MARFLVALQPSTTAPQIIDILKTLQANQGRLTQAWGPFALLAEGPDTARTAVQAKPGVIQAVGTGAFISPSPSLDPVAAALVAALNVGLLPAFLNPPAPVSPAPTRLAPVGCGGGAAPMSPAPGTSPAGFVGRPSDPGLALSPALVFPFRRALVNTIGVAVLLIDGPAGTSARFTLEESAIAIKALSDGLDGLHKVAPAAAHLVFTPAIHRVEIDLQPADIPPVTNRDNPPEAEFEPIEKTWRDKALTKLGAGTGRAGYRALVNKSNFLYKVDWGFVIVITKYRAAWPAYAPDFRDVIVSYDEVKTRLPLGLRDLPETISHEIGHTVGALDEYASSGCNVIQGCGFSNFANANCEVLNPFSIPCLMKSGPVTAICPATKSHFGWGDQNFDGVLDPFDPTFVPLP